MNVAEPYVHPCFCLVSLSCFTLMHLGMAFWENEHCGGVMQLRVNLGYSYNPKVDYLP